MLALAQEQAAPDAPSIPIVPAIGELPRDLSPWGMFVNADILVQAVLLGLVFASLVTWTVWLAKTIELVIAKRRLAQAMKALASHRFLTDAAREAERSNSPVREFVAAATAELRLSSDFPDREGIKERIASRLERIEAARARRILRGTGLLATIGATAPFVGLFGTVWGIMNSFIGISKSQTTNLAVVAPGIAEALLATAIGLVAAIPAVIIYNHFARVTKGYMELVGRASGAAGRLLSRDLDRTHVSGGSRAAAE
jgi:biopolymer transport protein ExbB